MELLTKTREELTELAGKLKLKPPKDIQTEELREMVHNEAIRKTVEIEERARLKLQEQSKIKRDIAEIQAEAGVRNIKIDVPKEPTIEDIARLRKIVNLKSKEPKPSPETVAIEGGIDPITGKRVEPSKKVYALFHNREQEDMDVTFCCGGKYWFHLWPEKVHILPEWLIGWLRVRASVPVYAKKMVISAEAAEVGQTVEKSQLTSRKSRFLFEILGPAPDKASFGVVLDTKVLSKLKHPV